MTLSTSGLFVLVLIALVMWRKDGLKVWHALVCALLGFYLAFTSIAPSIRQGTTAVTAFIGSIKF